MPDCFLSYASEDKEVARSIASRLKAEQITVFLAADSIEAGLRWSEEVWNNLRDSPCVIFIASRAAFGSSFVQQELGGALAGGKRIVSLVLNDVTPGELPGWISQYQAVQIPDSNDADLARKIEEVATVIRSHAPKSSVLIADVEHERMVAALVQLKELMTAQLKAIDDVTAPILEGADFLLTYDRFQKLVNNTEFPQGYGRIKGFLKYDVLYKDQFREGRVRKLLEEAISEVTGFQTAAFMKHTEWGDSYQMAEAFRKARELRTLLARMNGASNKEVNALAGEVHEIFERSFVSMVTEDNERTSFRGLSLKTTEDVLGLVQVWCRVWQRSAKQALIRYKIDEAIGALESI